MKKVILLIAMLGWAMPAAGGVVVLKDGTVLEGRIQPTREGFIVTDASGKATTVAAGDVQSMQPDKPGGNAPAAQPVASDLATLRRSVAAVSDPKQAVERYRAFLGRNPTGATLADAEKDLAQWRDRVDRGLMRSGDQWITAAQVTERQKDAVAFANIAMPVIAAGNYAGGELVVDKGLANSPANPALLYLKGLILFQQNKQAPARKAFEGVLAALPGHWASHNNLAVILFQTRSQMPAMAEYDKAMLVDPENQLVLDNVAEALHQLPPTSIKNEVIRKVVAHFTEQDAALQKKMAAEKGMMRVGAQWVTSEDYKFIQATRKDTEAKIEQYRKESVDLPNQITTMSTDLTIKTNAMTAIQQEYSGIDAYGHIVYSPLPQRYFELKQQVEMMTAERLLKQRQLDQLPRLMSEAQKELAGAQDRYAGRQSMADAYAMPGGVRPATQPATQPG